MAMNMSNRPTDAGNSDILHMTSTIAAAFLSNHNGGAQVADIPHILGIIHEKLSALATGHAHTGNGERPQPAVPIRSSVKKDHIVCLEDGRKVKLLRPHLRKRYNMSPDEYRARWGLPADYPMVSPGYTETRRRIAIDAKLGQNKG